MRSLWYGSQKEIGFVHQNSNNHHIFLKVLCFDNYPCPSFPSRDISVSYAISGLPFLGSLLVPGLSASLTPHQTDFSYRGVKGGNAVFLLSEQTAISLGWIQNRGRSPELEVAYLKPQATTLSLSQLHTA